MERDFKRVAVAIKSEKGASSDRIISFFTSDGEIVKARCYGSRKTIKGLRIPLYSEGVISFYSQGSGLSSVKDADIISTHDDVKSDWRAEMLFSLIAELLLSSPDLDRRAYSLYLSSLDRIGEAGLYRVGIVFIVKFLDFLGLSSDYKVCPKCLREYSPDDVLGYSPTLMSPVCSECDETGSLYPLYPNARKYLARMIEVSVDHAYLLNVSPMMERRIFSYLLRLLHFFPQRLMSLNILERELE